MYTVAVTQDFIANHYLIGGDWGDENSPHAHHYVLEARIESDMLNEHGYLVDIVEIEAAVKDAVDYYRDSMLNDKPEFASINPSLEHFSRILTEKMLAGITPPGNGALIVKLWENESCWAAFRQSFG
ncbi:MAG: 6-pyruvoyltetrahydropterin/6-carboxytetrahydropterin synthase [Halieaceae bacterium]|jgi:6-pyruvoyltetrahydropterin/6-carboxytetrahydropterin synthase